MRVRLLLVTLLGLVAMSGAGVAAAASATGTLVFQHDATGRGTLGAAVRLFGDDDDVVGLAGDVAGGGNAGEISEGQRVEKVLPVGEHVLILFTEGNPDLLGATRFTVEAGGTTTIRASRVLSGASESSTAAPIRTPNRVDTGAGGAARDVTAPLAILLLVFAAVIACGLARRPT